MITRAIAEAVFRAAVTACDPVALVARALSAPEVAPRLAGRRRFGLAIGKAAAAMAHGAGQVAEGLAIVPAGAEVSLPPGWHAIVSAHPVPDERSLAAARAARALVARASPRDVVLALVSGGASALLEEPRGVITLAELVAVTSAVMASGAPIGDLNTVRSALSAVKAGGLVAACAAPVVTLAVSDVIGDPLEVIGSGPTVPPHDPGAHDAGMCARAIELLARIGMAVPPSIDEVLRAPRAPAGRTRRGDLARVIAPMSSLAQATIPALARRGVHATLRSTPLVGDVAELADTLAEVAAPTVAWGEPTLRVPPDHGEGGRAQQLALLLARRLRGTSRAALVIGSDGMDGPPPRGRPAPAGAFVDGATWDAIAQAGQDPAAALARCDAGTALAAVGALVVTGPTGINHADLVLVG